MIAFRAILEVISPGVDERCVVRDGDHLYEAEALTRTAAGTLATTKAEMIVRDGRAFLLKVDGEALDAFRDNVRAQPPEYLLVKSTDPALVERVRSLGYRPVPRRPRRSRTLGHVLFRRWRVSGRGPQANRGARCRLPYGHGGPHDT